MSETKKSVGQGILPVTDATWQEKVIKDSSIVPILVDFWAEWCGPCKALTPILVNVESTMNRTEGKIRIYTINVDQNPVTTGRYGISGIPALIMFREGEPVAEMFGLKPMKSIIDWFTEFLEPTGWGDRYDIPPSVTRINS
jgi:thioredoxin 1